MMSISSSSKNSLHATAWILSLALLTLFSVGCRGGAEATTVDPAEQRSAELDARDAELAAREAEIAERETQLAEQRDQIAAQLETLEQRQGTVISRLDEIAAREARVNRKESTVRTAESDLTAEQRALEAERRRLEENSVQLKAERAAAEEAARLAAERERQEPTTVEAIAELAADTPFDVELGTTLSSHGSRVGDRFSTRLDHDLVTADGVLVAPAGSELRGVVTEAVPLKKVGGRARLGLRFGELVLPSGKTVELAATLFEIGRNETKRDAAKIGGGAAAGALLGHLIDKDDGAVLGALIGAAAGTAASRGQGGELEIPAGTILRLTLDQPLRVAVPWTPPRR